MHDGTYFFTGDVGGIVTIYKPNVEKMIVVKAHVPILEKTSSFTVTSIATSPTNFMFCSSAEDASIKIWDLGKISQRQKLPLRKYGHGGNVLTVDWHQMKGLIVSGSENNMIKFWDPRSKNCIGNIYDHTSRVNVVEFNRNGNWLLSASNDQTCRIFDIRTNRQMECFKGHNQEVNCASWHPIHEDLLVSGSKDGKMFYWVVGSKITPIMKSYHHDSSITCMSWHPMGYLLATGSLKANVKLWVRARPCEIFSDKTLG
jgi:polyadenylation factor subunit 2